MVVLQVTDESLPGHVHWGHLLPQNRHGQVWRIDGARSLAAMNLHFLDFITSLEDELQRSLKAPHVDGQERAFLVSVVPYGSTYPVEDSVEELRELSRTAGLDVLGTMVQRPRKINPKYLMGGGKLKELIIKVLQLGADIIVFDQNLLPGQVNAIGEVTDLKVIDRTQLILDIFAKRAHSKDGKVRVELAQLKYLMPRLTGKGTAMSRLMGGIGGRGPGETKLEIDRRRIKDRIHMLEKRLRDLGEGRWQRRRKRRRQGLPIVSIVGYTNAGKSTLLNAMTLSEVEVENKLFATLDTSSRRLRFPREREVIITDTVGIIRNLPPDLLGAFRSTLDELQDADLFLHVIDVSNPRYEEQLGTVEELLSQLNLSHIPLLRVFNKQDRVSLETATVVAHRYGGLTLSALDSATLPPLLQRIETLLWDGRGAAGDRPQCEGLEAAIAGSYK
jgi:GTP-binding protein HflX